jgi:hypothetical protein
MIRETEMHARGDRMRAASRPSARAARECPLRPSLPWESTVSRLKPVSIVDDENLAAVTGEEREPPTLP